MQEAKAYCRDIVEILQTLKRTRDMAVQEARLIIAIEDPRARERRTVGIEVRRRGACCRGRRCGVPKGRLLWRPAGPPPQHARACRPTPPCPLPPQDERGVSRDEMAAALLEVAEGRVPRDRIALKCVYEEMSGWPFLAVEEASSSGAGGAGRASAPAQSAESVYAELNDGARCCAC